MLSLKMSLNGSPQSFFPSIAPSKGSPERSTSQKRETGVSGSDGASAVSAFSPTKDGRATEKSLPKLVNDRAETSTSPEERSPRLKVTTVQQISKSSDDQMDHEFYPEPLPYQPQLFKSSTVLKMVSVPNRHQAMFGGKLFTNRKKGIIVHAERYQWNQKPNTEDLLQQQSMLAPLGFTETKTVSRLSQRDRLLAERAYMERMRGIKRKREILPHREPKDLLMQSAKAEFSERFDVTGELQRLKSIVLPVNARELYHGKGIQLPSNHSSLKPRPRPPPYPSQTVASSAPAGLDKGTPHKPPKLPSRSLTQPSLRQPATKRKSSLTSSSLTKTNTDPVIKRQVFPKIQAETKKTVQPAASPSNTSETSKMPAIETESIVSRKSAPSIAKPRTTPQLLTESEEEDNNNVNPSWTVANRAESEMEIDVPPEPIPQSLSIPNSMAASPAKAVTPNPLKVPDMTILVSDEEHGLLKETFHRLDNDKDGHLTFVQAKNIIPKEASASEEKYLKQVYDITSASTFFGLNEFITLSCLCQEITKLGDVAKDAFNHLNFQSLHESIIQYVELFESKINEGKGSISLDSLDDILCTGLGKDKTTDQTLLLEIRRLVNPDMEDSVSKVKFLAHIPYFLTFEES